jgi:hypothetical protein
LELRAISSVVKGCACEPGIQDALRHPNGMHGEPRATGLSSQEIMPIEDLEPILHGACNIAQP